MKQKTFTNKKKVHGTINRYSKWL